VPQHSVQGLLQPQSVKDRPSSDDDEEDNMLWRRRVDNARACHHVYYRGLAKRAMFERAADVTRFLGLIGEADSFAAVSMISWAARAGSS